MLPVAEARERIVGALTPVAPEIVGIAVAWGRVLAEDVAARLTHPPDAVSAMDGYAVRAADVAAVPARLRTIGRSAAGDAFDGEMVAGTAVRIFTGAALPKGADAVVIQEDTDAEGDAVIVRASVVAGRHVRAAGLDFRAGDVALAAGQFLGVRHIGLAAAMNVPWLRVRRRPRVALLATGDEIVRPGDPVGCHQIVSSNTMAMAALLRSTGAEAIDLGIAPDDPDALAAMVTEVGGADLLITMGGASVGDHDLVQGVLKRLGLALDFWQVAMRPGKPLMFGRLGATPVIGLPGNPVSSLVCALVFVVPAVRRLLGLADAGPLTGLALLGRDLPANDRRQDYMRSELARAPDGRLTATPFKVQDSSMLVPLTRAGCLVVRPPFAPAITAGSTVSIIAFEPGATGF
ncbi:MAG: molybdopterin molybdotransferase MoeA [Alphaproteobacteria bacterium]|nr:molybdopterin molybdotransferase MoeA [Alphaproteobacteria bacterium]